jgi:hypothetical protein
MTDPDELDANDESALVCSDLDAALEGQPIEPPSLAGAAGRPKCRRHTWVTITHPDDYTEHECSRCGQPRDLAVSRRANNNRKRGNRIQRERIVALGGRNLAGNNPGWDGTSELFSFESKSGGFFSERHWRVLNAIPRQGQQSAVLIVTEAPGPGRKARSYVVVSFDDWRALHGEAK